MFVQSNLEDSHEIWSVGFVKMVRIDLQKGIQSTEGLSVMWSTSKCQFLHDVHNKHFHIHCHNNQKLTSTNDIPCGTHIDCNPALLSLSVTKWHCMVDGTYSHQYLDFFCASSSQMTFPSCAEGVHNW